MRGRLGPGLGLALLAAACALGARGEGFFEAEHPLGSADALIVDVPDSPLRVRGCDGAVPESCPPTLRYQGRWLSTGATAAEAERNARRPQLIFEREDRLARLRADIPLDVTDLVDLELEELRLPDDLDLDLRTSLGDVDVGGVAGAVLIETDAGDVTVSGAPASLGVYTAQGSVHATVNTECDLRTGDGDVDLEQTADGRSVFVEAGGEVRVVLGSDLDVEFRIRTPGRIRVETDSVSALTRDRFDRTVAAGGTLVEIVADGPVEVRQRSSSE